MPESLTQTEAPAPEEHKASSREIRSAMDEFFEVTRPTAPPVGQIPQFPDKTPLPEPAKEEPPKEEKPADQVQKATDKTPVTEKTDDEPEAKTTVGGMTEKAPRTTAEPPKAEPAEDLVGDEELDKIALRPHTRPEVKDQFRQLKLSAKAAKDEARAATKLKAELEATIQQLRSGGAIQDPEIQARIKRADEIMRVHDLSNYSEYQQKFGTPLNTKWKSLITVLKDTLGADKDPRIAEWADNLEKLGPDHQGLSKEWWAEQLSKIPDEDERADLRAHLRDIVSIRRERDRFVKDLGSDEERFKEFTTKQFADYYQKYGREVEEATKPLFDELKIGEWGKGKDPALAKNDAEKKAIEAHNERFFGYQNQFKDFLGSIHEQAPAKHAKLCMLAVKGIHLESELGEVTKHLAEANKKIQTLESQLNKTLKLRSTPEKANGAPTPRASQPVLSAGPRGESSVSRTKRIMDEFFERKQLG